MARKRSAVDSDDEEYVAHAPVVRKRDRKAGKQQQQVHAVAVRKAPRSSSKSTSSVALSQRVASTVTPDQIIPSGFSISHHQQQQQVVYEYDEEDEVTEEDEEGEHAGRGAFDEEHEADESDDEEEEEIAAPVVFQCGTCRSIFGDSYSFVGSNAELLLVTLSAVTNITTAKEPQTSKDGMDMGSSFQELLCAQCQTVLGRKYVTTPVPLDPIRGLYSFATNTIASYQLGYPQLSLEQGALSTSVDAIKRATIECDEAVKLLSVDRNEVGKLRADMTKVQNLLLVVDERLHQLETGEPDSEAEDVVHQQGRRRR